MTGTPADTHATMLARCVGSARRFRGMVAVAPTVLSRAWVADVCLALCELYTVFTSAAQVLQPARDAPALPPKPFGLDAYDWDSAKEVGATIAARLGQADLYWEYFDPRDATSGLSTTVSNDLAEILCDIQPIADLATREGAMTGETAEGILRECVEVFTIHWGDHLVDVLRILHRLAHADEERGVG